VSKRRVVLFGGTFDPIHVGHTTVARAALEQLGGERLIFIPARRSPHKHIAPVASGEHRLAMVRLAIAGDPRLEVSDCELHRPDPSYTLETVQHFRRIHGQDVELCWLIGADAAVDLHRWYRVGELLERCRICVMRRPGTPQPDVSKLEAVVGSQRARALREDVVRTPLIDASSSQVRQGLARGRDVRGLLDPAVLAYIQRHGLYGACNGRGGGTNGGSGPAQADCSR